MQDEVTKLIEANLIREVHYLEWLANMVLGKKAIEKWWICINFTDQNKVYPKDSYPLPMINWLIDVTSSFEVMSFIDVFSSYNQI